MAKEELTLEEQVERVRRKRRRATDHSTLRKMLNAAFLLLALVGVVWYLTATGNRVPALAVIATGMMLKVVEFVVRFFF